MSCGVIITGKPDAGKMYQLGRDFALAVFADLARKENFDCEDILHGLLTGGQSFAEDSFHEAGSCCGSGRIDSDDREPQLHFADGIRGQSCGRRQSSVGRKRRRNRRVKDEK